MTLYKYGVSEKHFRMHNMSHQELKTTLGSSPVSQKQKSEVAMGTGSLRLDS